LEKYKRLIGQKIRTKRKEKGLSQEALGNLVGTDQSRIARWERGENLPDPSARVKLIEALETDESLFDPSSKISATQLTPETLAAIQQATRDAVKASLEEVKGLPNNFEYAKPMSPKEELLSLIERLDSNGIDAILTAVRAALSSDPITSSALDESKRPTPVRKRKA
jgi:transcriptional regulator with XRE-family HTH domain